MFEKMVTRHGDDSVHEEPMSGSLVTTREEMSESNAKHTPEKYIDTKYFDKELSHDSRARMNKKVA